MYAHELFRMCNTTKVLDIYSVYVLYMSWIKNVECIIYDSEREKKDAMVMRQRAGGYYLLYVYTFDVSMDVCMYAFAELHVKQGIYELAPAVEREIESDILHSLQLGYLASIWMRMFVLNK